MPRFLRPLARAVTYTRWLHLLCSSVLAFVFAMVYPGLSAPSLGAWVLIYVIPVPLLLVLGTIPVLRRSEGLQARMMLFPGKHARVAGTGAEREISVVPSASWQDRGRTSAWLVFRLFLGLSVALFSGQIGALAMELTGAAMGERVDELSALPVPGTAWSCAVAIPFVLIFLVYVAAGAGWLTARTAQVLLGPSGAERLAALEERTEQLLERNRIARELHDSIGHALTVAVVQAGAARAAGDPMFTDRALGAIEETGRAALEELERVLLVLREAEQPVGSRPTLQEADRLLDSARASGAKVEVTVSGPLETVPGPVSREGYRILQEALTNVLRHCGTVPVTVTLHVADKHLVLEVRNPLPPERGSGHGGTGSGLRGVRERAALLGGHARTGPLQDEWQVHVELPVA
ncbi:sensor histidine kinase [Streptomyces endophyticus]|uniref:histidine kinase n=1 Tax=Streptomyces endophyticus TaxID=714166 RepID=A0ABU6FMX5_9ACTN|nr:histidine kinase [Streptomyces endophyticus]MEB8344221.1 histidine kinase [Streptomyces endophyticus]